MRERNLYIPSLPLLLALCAAPVSAQGGGVFPAANRALPSAYAFQEYRYAEPQDAQSCTGAGNASAVIGKVTLAQTHVMEPAWPFFFLAAGRPALLQAAVTGSGPAPDVRVEATVGGAPVGSLCLKGPSTLPAAAAAAPRFDDRFSATLPSAWIRPGLALTVKAGGATRAFTASQLKVGAAPELNLILVPLDLLDFNRGKPDIRPPASFLPDIAGALPASVVRLGVFPRKLVLPTLAVAHPTELAPVILETGADKQGVPDMNIQAAASRVISAFKRASGEYPFATHFGHTQHFNPGGWGGDRSFTGADFDDVFLHEYGHGLSLPHWGQGAYGNASPGEWGYRYPYGGNGADGGGRGESWNYYQNLGEFVSPLCELAGHRLFGKERSDAMQRNQHCEESRLAGKGPWDGFGDFSAYAMHRYLAGAAAVQTGTVPYRGGEAPYHLGRAVGFPNLRLDSAGRRVLLRENQVMEKQSWERHDFAFPQAWETPVYTVFGTYHPQYGSANIIYDPVAWMGHLPRLLDPTDPDVFKDLAAGSAGPYGSHFWWEKDLTLKLVYADGMVRHAIYPHEGVSRNWKPEASPWRGDLLYFALNVPADRKLVRIELHRRPFLVRGRTGTEEGNIANPALGITAENYMTGAVLIAGRNVNVEPPADPTLGILRAAHRKPGHPQAPAGRAADGAWAGLGIPGAQGRVYDFLGRRVGRLPEAPASLIVP